jgi:hypothetical protein
MTRSGVSSVSFTFADQAVSSASNVALTLFVAHNVGTTQFGAFTVIVGVYLIVTLVGRAIIGEPLLVKFPGAHCGQDQAGYAIVASLKLGSVLGVALVLAGLLGPEELRLGLIVLGVTLPGLMTQDALRYIAFTRNRPKEALWNDVIWAILQLVLTWYMLHLGESSTADMVGAWSVAGLLAGLTSMALYKTYPRSGGRWFRTTRHLGSRYVVESVAATVTLQLVTIGVATFGGYGAAGALKLAQTVFGPINIVYAAARVALLSKLACGLSHNARIFSTAVGASIAVATVPALVMLGIWIAPDTLVTGALGTSGHQAEALFPLIFAQKVAACLGLGGICILRVWQKAKETQRISLWNSFVVLASATMFIPEFAALGAAVALLIGSIANSIAFWRGAVVANPFNKKSEGHS